jgi:hypothetical protein
MSVAPITDWGTALVTSLSAALAAVFTFIPKLIGFLVILLVGWLVATAVSKAVTFLLRKVGFDRMAQRIGLTRFEQRMGVTLDPAGVLGKIVYWFIFLIFLVPAADSLGLAAVSNVLNTLVDYIPNVFVAILVLFLGALAATFVADIVRGATASANLGNPNVYAAISRYAIIGFAALVALEQLQIAPTLLNELFGALVAALALAFGLAFGLGGRETAQRLLNRTENTVSSAASQISTQQAQQEAYQEQQAYQQQQPYPQVPQQKPTRQNRPH